MRLRHIRDATDKIADYCARGREAFDAESVIRDAILYQIVVIGEAAKAVVEADPELAGRLTMVEWSALARMRDRLTHQYWATDRNIVWNTASGDIPQIREAVARALESFS